ncbi:hypothetical protein BKA62DRAFT_675083 [Auriculariales sp. MPI-PUGE-AT-0066]|nr:hypothetical protein BKA62DRAFT_675083 [Auriculariales sp. MPI-PUGE-AT-0066]
MALKQWLLVCVMLLYIRPTRLRQCLDNATLLEEFASVPEGADVDTSVVSCINTSVVDCVGTSIVGCLEYPTLGQDHLWSGREKTQHQMTLAWQTQPMCCSGSELVAVDLGLLLIGTAGVRAEVRYMNKLCRHSTNYMKQMGMENDREWCRGKHSPVVDLRSCLLANKEAMVAGSDLHLGRLRSRCFLRLVVLSHCLCGSGLCGLLDVGLSRCCIGGPQGLRVVSGWHCSWTGGGQSGVIDALIAEIAITISVDRRVHLGLEEPERQHGRVCLKLKNRSKASSKSCTAGQYQCRRAKGNGKESKGSGKKKKVGAYS